MLSSPIINRDTLNLFAQVPVQVADEGIHHLPLMILHLAVNLGYQQPARCLIPLYPAGVLDMLPAPLPYPVERRVGATEATLRVLQDGFSLELAPGFGTTCKIFMAAPPFLWAGK